MNYPDNHPSEMLERERKISFLPLGS